MTSDDEKAIARSLDDARISDKGEASGRSLSLAERVAHLAQAYVQAKQDADALRKQLRDLQQS